MGRTLMTRPREPWSSNRHAPGGLGEQRIVLAQTDVETRAEASSPLPYQDRSTLHQVAVGSFHAKPLRLAVTPVSRAALPFLVCHTYSVSIPVIRTPVSFAR